MKVFIASDHAGFEVKEELAKILSTNNLLKVVNLGPSSDERTSYSEYAEKLARALQLENDSRARGILICGSGIGVSMAANRFKNIRAARVLSIEDALLSRQHNDANVLCLAARQNSKEELQEIIKVWFNTDFEGSRHMDRIKQFNNLGE